MEFFKESDFELIGKNAGQDPDPVEHEKLKHVYQKLEHLCKEIATHGFEYSIRKDPRKQAGPGIFKFEHYHWAKIFPKGLKSEMKDKFAYIVGVADTLHCHMMGVGNYQSKEASKEASQQSWTTIPIDGASHASVARKFREFDDKHRNLFIDTGAKLGIAACQKIKNQRIMIEREALLTNNKQIILQGPPGTGKTRVAKDLAEQVILGSFSQDKHYQTQKLKHSDRYSLVQFHSSYTYEDFVRGIEVKTNKDNQVEYLVRNKILGEMAAKAWQATETHNNDLAQAYKEHLEERQSIAQNTEDYYYFSASKDVRLINIAQSQIKNNNDRVGFLRFEVKNLDKGNWYMPEWIPMNKHFNHEEIQRSELPAGRGYTAVLKDFLAFAEKPPEYVLIIDEINRANLPAVLGELIYALEYRGEPVQSMYGIKKNENTGSEGDEDELDNREIILPNNLYIIGTMNTADRSVGHIDYAIRRRFAFVEMLPENLEELEGEFRTEAFQKVSDLFVKEVKTSSNELVASDHLSDEFSDRPEDVWIGHSYFIAKEEDFKIRLKYEVVPILEEYIKDGILKNSAKEVIKELLETYG